jgi:hypothetical protein
VEAQLVAPDPCIPGRKTCHLVSRQGADDIAHKGRAATTMASAGQFHRKPFHLSRVGYHT